jgi:hypothetical protein
MKKLIFSMAVATLFIACDNAANSGSNAQDSLDSVANAKKEKKLTLQQSNAKQQ